MAGNSHTENRLHYETLGLAPGAGVRDVKKRARMLLLRFHPDLNPGNIAFCEEKTKGIAAAYTALLRSLEAIGSEPGGPAPEACAGGGALVFELSHRLFALPAAHVRGVLRVKDTALEDLSIVADAFPYMCGVFHHRGDLVMLWNLHAQLGLREPAVGSGIRRAMLVHAECDGSPVGFLADAVHGMEPDQGAQAGAEPSGDFILGIMQTPHGPAALLDMHALLYGAEHAV